MTRRRIDEIVVGERHRRDLGDIDGLAASIAEMGLLHPVVVTPANVLIAGARRLRAAELLGWTETQVTVVDLDAVVRGEFTENTYRKDFTPSELVAIGAEVERIERERASRRQGSRTDLVESCHEVEFGKTRDKTAAQLGISGRTYERAKAVVDAATAEPERFGKLVEDMDRTGRVNGVYRRLKIAKQAEAIRAEPPPLPGNGPYRVIACDPPWRYEKRDEDPSHRNVRPYHSMSIDEICAMNVASIAHEDCILWLWVTNHHMREAFRVLDAWGFEQKTILTWAKERRGGGVGDWLLGQTEHCLLAVRGTPPVSLTTQTTLLSAPRRAHSQKPVEFYNLVESLCPAPRYASRYRHNEKWDCHGDEIPQPANVEAAR